jgi:hypothetical protein
VVFEVVAGQVLLATMALLLVVSQLLEEEVLHQEVEVLHQEEVPQLLEVLRVLDQV